MAQPVPGRFRGDPPCNGVPRKAGPAKDILGLLRPWPGDRRPEVHHLRRYEKWLANPEKAAWHACKRILAYELMLSEGRDEAALRRYLLDAPWFCDYARHAFGAAPQEFVEPLVGEMLRSKAAEWREGKLVARAPFNPPPAAWPQGPARPKSWPRAEASDPLPA